MKLEVLDSLTARRGAWLAWAWALLMCLSGSAWAQTSYVTLSPGFQPARLEGLAGGPVDATAEGSSPTGSCAGWIANEPNHVLTLTDHFDYLAVEVSSSEDTTLVVYGPVGVWCNDDSNDLNPALSGQWDAGDYRIFVGTYHQVGQVPYTITFDDGSGEVLPPTPPIAVHPPPGSLPPLPSTPGPTPPQTPQTIVPTPPPGTPFTPPPGVFLDIVTADSNYDAVELSAGFAPDPQVLSGTSGGTVDVAPLGSTGTGSCVGSVSSLPDHLMTLATPFEFLDVSVESSGDTTLVIHGPDGWWCNDDTVGVNPGISGSWIPGSYRIWVGSYGRGDYHAYTIRFSQHRPGQVTGPGPVATGGSGPDLVATAGTYSPLTLTPGALGGGQSVSGVSGGPFDIAEYASAYPEPCVGSVAGPPDHLMTLTSDFEQLNLTVDSPGDTTLAIHGPNGWRCNDDMNGLNPGLTGRWPAGTYRVWVGSYGAGMNHTYTLSASEGRLANAAAPVPGMNLTTASGRYGDLTVTSANAGSPQTLAGVSGGPLAASGLGGTWAGPCRGGIAADPDHLMTLNTDLDDLGLAVSSQGDTTLVLQGPDGWICNDDDNGLNPGIHGRWRAGTYRIWVGSYDPSEYHEYSLEVGPSGLVGRSAGLPGLSRTATAARYGGVSLAPGFTPDPQSLTGTSGGPLDASPLGQTATGPCVGWIAGEPSHMMSLTDYFEYLRVEIGSVDDTTLVIEGPDGWWCNDDAVGLNPRIAGQWVPGTYRIWVGSWSRGEAHPYTITFSEIRL